MGWFEDLFIEEARPALKRYSGSGGSGISVTGATVGQTVKISAVDNNGVPTAWEPVDFPTDDYINNLINIAFGVIENGTY